VAISLDDLSRADVRGLLAYMAPLLADYALMCAEVGQRHRADRLARLRAVCLEHLDTLNAIEKLRCYDELEEDVYLRPNGGMVPIPPCPLSVANFPTALDIIGEDEIPN
jgi:hypothetical protein